MPEKLMSGIKRRGPPVLTVMLFLFFPARGFLVCSAVLFSCQKGFGIVCRIKPFAAPVDRIAAKSALLGMLFNLDRKDS